MLVSLLHYILIVLNYQETSVTLYTSFFFLFRWCESLDQGVPEEFANYKVNKLFTNHASFLGSKLKPNEFPAPLFDGWLCNHKGEWLFRRTYFGDEILDGSAPSSKEGNFHTRMVHLPSILPRPVWNDELTKLPFV